MTPLGGELPATELPGPGQGKKSVAGFVLDQLRTALNCALPMTRSPNVTNGGHTPKLNSVGALQIILRIGVFGAAFQKVC